MTQIITINGIKNKLSDFVYNTGLLRSRRLFERNFNVGEPAIIVLDWESVEKPDYAPVEAKTLQLVHDPKVQ